MLERDTPALQSYMTGDVVVCPFCGFHGDGGSISVRENPNKTLRGTFRCDSCHKHVVIHPFHREDDRAARRTVYELIIAYAGATAVSLRPASDVEPTPTDAWLSPVSLVDDVESVGAGSTFEHGKVVIVVESVKNGTLVSVLDKVTKRLYGHVLCSGQFEHSVK